MVMGLDQEFGGKVCLVGVDDDRCRDVLENLYLCPVVVPRTSLSRKWGLNSEDDGLQNLHNFIFVTGLSYTMILVPAVAYSNSADLETVSLQG